MPFDFDNKLVGTSANDNLTGTNLRDFIIANNGEDVVRGRQGDDFLLGGQGNDNLRGNRGEDILFGGLGDDDLHGGRDNDVLAGEFGADVLRGGNDRFLGDEDTFLFAARSAGYADKSGALASDTIVDFEAGFDILQFEDYDAAAQLSYVQDGDDVIVSVDADGAGAGGAIVVVTVLNATIAEVSAAAIFADFTV